MAAIDRTEFEKNPARYLETFITKYAATSPKNVLPSFNGEPIFDAPMVGFADGDDPIFEYYKVVALESHLTPREALGLHLKARGNGKEPSRVSVIVFVMPITALTRLSLRQEKLVPSLRWNHTRWQGQYMMEDLVGQLVSRLEGLGHEAVAPELTSFFERRDTPTGRSSNWSQRHAAYAAGLGTFSLSDGLITPRGIAMRCGSVVTDAPIPASPRTYPYHLANCLFYEGQSCRRCIERCPAGAITEQGHDRLKCSEFVQVEQRNILQQMRRGEGYIGKYLGCGLCQVKVPCESMIPQGKRA